MTASDFQWIDRGVTATLSERARERGAFVLFLPLAYAPVCREDVRRIVAGASDLGGGAAGRPLIVVSVDRAEHLRRFLDEHGDATARVLGHAGDPTLAIAQSYGVRRKEGFAERASFLVGRDGSIVASAVHPIGFPRPLDVLREWLTRLT